MTTTRVWTRWFDAKKQKVSLHLQKKVYFCLIEEFERLIKDCAISNEKNEAINADLEREVRELEENVRKLETN